MLSSTSNQTTNVAVIIRSVGERTETLCRHLVEQQVPSSHVVVINERPFSKAVQRTFEIGLDFRKDWTLAVDADMLLQQNAISELISAIEKMPENSFSLDGRLWDKLLGHLRVGGPHLYRTNMLPKAIEFVREAVDTIRPESYVKEKMAEVNDLHYKVANQIVVGLHDYEQFYTDIYRKAILHTRKFSALMGYLVPMWSRLKEDDDDFLVALWGYRAGQILEDNITPNRDLFPDEMINFLKFHGMEERDPLVLKDWSFERVNYILQTASHSPEFLQYVQESQQTQNRLSRLHQKFDQLGTIKFIPWITGRSFIRVGSILVSLAEKDRHH